MPEASFQPPPLTPNQRAWKRFWRNRPAKLSTLFISALILAVCLWPMVAWQDPNKITDAQFQPPSLQHWFGTDVHGRDVFSRVLYGAQVSLLVGVVGAGVSLVIGVLWGAIAGYAGGRTDSAMMRFVDILYSLPSIIFVIVLITTLEGLLQNRLAASGSPAVAKFSRLLFLFVGLGAVSWLNMARIVRGQVLSLRTRQFVDASRVLGAGPGWILRRHIIPNVLGVVIVYLTLTVP
ncbi:MAG TPA: ABC transporter permease, partial [Verrucomicrobiae bacterium]|nr:ABC transporter permease [Verrucomicrobiae bacterium]